MLEVAVRERLTATRVILLVPDGTTLQRAIVGVRNAASRISYRTIRWASHPTTPSHITSSSSFRSTTTLSAITRNGRDSGNLI